MQNEINQFVVLTLIGRVSNHLIKTYKHTDKTRNDGISTGTNIVQTTFKLSSKISVKWFH